MTYNVIFCLLIDIVLGLAHLITCLGSLEHISKFLRCGPFLIQAYYGKEFVGLLVAYVPSPINIYMYSVILS